MNRNHHRNQPTPFGRALLAAVLVAVSAPGLQAQVPLDRGVSGTALSLRHLDGVKRVLMIGAHPDDEDTALLTALARGMGAETAYLSLTRGDGGQNLIGPELGEGLGVVRTGELMAARALDGGGQFFSRAFDFGYSKNADEALRLWPREELLRDVVWVIRNYHPQVIVSVWTGTTADGHGQHQASGIIATEAFEAAADPSVFPDMAALGAPAWQADKFYQRRRGAGQDGIETSVPTGTFDPVLGRSHLQLAMDSRSQHRSQDMGAGQPFGSRASQLVLINRAPGLNVPDGDFFSGVDTTLVGVSESLIADRRAAVAAHLGAYSQEIARAGRALSPVDPSAVVQPLNAARSHLVAAMTAAEGAPADNLAVRTMRDRLGALDQTLLQAAGVVVRVRAEDDLIVPGEPAEVIVELWNGGGQTLSLAQSELALPANWRATLTETDVPNDATSEAGNPGYRVPPGAVVSWHYRVDVPADAELSRLYFRAVERDGEMYRWPDQPELWGLPRDPAPINGSVWFMTDAPAGTVPADWTTAGSIATLTTTLPARYVGVDKALGEFTKPLLVVPAVSVAMTPSSLVWPLGADATKQVSVEVAGEAASGARGAVRLDVPAGWSVSPASQDFTFDGPAQSRTFTFDVQPAGAGAGSHAFQAVARLSDGREYREGFTLIDYEHIERTPMFDPARTNVTVVPVRVAEGRIGYIQGSGDDGLLALQQMGADAELVTIAQLRSGDLSSYDVLVLGIRVYETRPDVAAVNDQILEFARQGGTVVVQYNKYEYPAGNFAPYAVDMRPNSRTTDENSPVEFLNPQSPVFNVPNQIGMEDFDGWVQERGLYFLTEWEAPFEPVIAFTDPGEEPATGSIVIAPVGEGLYVYTGLSFFRQFPAGVAGAYRLFANLVSLRGEGVAR